MKTSGPSGVTAMVCSKWADRLPSAVTTLQLSSSSTGLGRADVDHGLDGEHVAGLEGGALAPGPVVGDLGLLVHGRPDGVAHVLPDHAEAGRLGHVLDRPADLVEGVALGHLLDPGPEAPLGDLQQLLGLLGDGADAHGEGGVAVVALNDGAAVDGEDVPLLQHVAARDAVHDHGVGRGADDGREAVVAEEVRGGAPALEDLAGDRVQVGGGDARLGGGAGRLVHLGHDLAGAAHLGQLVVVPPHWVSVSSLSFWRRVSMAPTTRRVTASGEPVPLISTRRLRSLYQSSRGAVSSS